MSSPLSLRLCCIAAMAPALTETTSQARIKLPGTPPSSTNTPVVNGRDQAQANHNNSIVADGQSLLEKTSRTPRPFTNLAGRIHLNGGSGVKPPVFVSQALSRPGLPSFGLSNNRQTIGKEERVPILQQDISKVTKAEIKDRMNQPAQHNDSSNGPGKDSCTGLGTLSSQTTFVNGKSEQGEGIGDRRRLNSRSGIVMGHLNKNNFCKLNSAVSGVVGEAEGCDNPCRAHTQRIDCHVSEVTVTVEATQSLTELEKRTAFVLRRLRRFQSRQVKKHIQQQLSHFVEYQHKNLQTVAKSIKSPSNNSNMTSSSDIKTDLFQSEDVKSLSTAALVNLVRRLQASQSFSLSQRVVASSAATKPETTNVLTMDKSTRTESQTASEHLSQPLHHAQSAIDSDATESSSGGESCDDSEEDGPKDKKFQHAPLHRRAEWKWAVERAAVASRWTWLQAQVSDLEYRIRQQSDIYKQIRASKGCVRLEEPSAQEGNRPLPSSARSSGSRTAVLTSQESATESSPCNISTLLSNVNKQASRLTQSLGNCLSPAQSSPRNNLKSSTSSPSRSLNGVIESPLGSSEDVSCSDGTGSSPAVTLEASSSWDVQDQSSCQAARCCPLKSCKKRKLLRTAGLHQIHRKAARLSSVKCHCYPPVTPCPMCGGRYNNTYTVDADVMPIQERVSILDPAFHHVLSFPQDIPLTVHFEALLKSGEWQNKPPPPRRARNDSDRRRPKILPNINDPARKASRQIRKNAVLLQTAKIRNKYENKTVRKSQTAGLGGAARSNAMSGRRLKSEMKRHRVKQLKMVMKRRSGRELSESLPGNHLGSYGNTPMPSPQSKDALSLSSSCPTSAFKETSIRRRRGESAFDINNIVIPYSIASSTRVEKLKYKPIDTPKWRDVTVQDEEDVPKPSPTEDAGVSSGSIPEAEPEGDGEADVEMEDEKKEAESEDEVEDMSDESYITRHQKCEAEEKKRFTAFVHYPARRGRTRAEIGQQLVDSVPLEVQDADAEFVPSLPSQSQVTVTPLTWSPQIRPSTPTLSSNNGEEGGIDRRRASSFSRKERFSFSSNPEDSRDYDTFEYVPVEPWPLRTFPLSQEEYDTMKAIQPPLYETRQANVTIETVSRSETPSSSHPCSPLPSSASNSAAGDDPNDPEWTAMGTDKSPKKLSLVVKVASKR